MAIASQSAQVTDEAGAPASKDAPRSALEVRLQKTKLCMYHLRSVCKHGSACRFAHGDTELVDQPDLSKTRMCPDLLAGQCNNPNCQHAHRLDEIQATNFCYKTTQCMWYASGRCRNGANCHFAHGEADRDTWLDVQRAGKGYGKGNGKDKEVLPPHARKQQKPVQKQLQEQQHQVDEQREQTQAVQKALQHQERQLQQLLQLQQWPPNFGEFQSKQQQQQLLQQEQHKLQERQLRQELQILQLQQQQQQQQQQRDNQAKEHLEPMFIQSSVDQIMPSHSGLPLPDILSVQNSSTSMGYPNNAGVPPGLSGAPAYSQPGLSQSPYMPTNSMGYFYHPGLAPIPSQQVPDAAEAAKMDALSKHIKSLRKQVRKLQGTMNHTMRSDSDQSTISGANQLTSVSDSSSNEDFMPSNGPSELDSRQVGNSLAVGHNNRHQASALRFADQRIIGA
jgi:hypothetical protein